MEPRQHRSEGCHAPSEELPELLCFFCQREGGGGALRHGFFLAGETKASRDDIVSTQIESKSLHREGRNEICTLERRIHDASELVSLHRYRLLPETRLSSGKQFQNMGLDKLR